MTRDELIAAVVLRMDEITPSSGLSLQVDASDGNPLYDLVIGLIDSGVLELLSVAPYWRLPQTPFSDIKVEAISSGADSRKIIRLKVPGDFLRVAEISHTKFQRPITEVWPEQTPLGKRQHNRHLMGKEAKPVGVLSFGKWTTGTGTSATTTQCMEIDCYSLPSTESGTSNVNASYIAKPASAVGTSSTTVPVPDVLLPALQWLIAARAFGARGDSNHAAICQQNAQNLLV